jgi:AAA15 family ATPase/GTPase
MIHEIKIKNFLSFKDEVVFSFASIILVLMRNIGFRVAATLTAT